MKRNLFILVFAILSLGIASNAQGSQRYEVKVGDFKQLRIINSVNVEYVCNPDSAGLAVFYTSPTKVNSLMFNNNTKGKLSIQLTTESALAPVDIPTVRVYSAFLQSAENEADSTLRIISVAPAPLLKFKLSGNGRLIAHDVKGTSIEGAIVTGNGKIILSGSCTNADLRCTGTGEVQADELVAKSVKCLIVGTGVIACNINEGPLSIKGSGTGKVYYRGVPTEIKSLQIGTIKAIPMVTK